MCATIPFPVEMGALGVWWATHLEKLGQEAPLTRHPHAKLQNSPLLSSLPLFMHLYPALTKEQPTYPGHSLPSSSVSPINYVIMP